MERPENLRLTRIRVYPLKGAAGIDLAETGLDEFGIPGDRRWMLAKSDGRFISQRAHPRLCLVRTALLDSGSEKSGLRFTLDAPGASTLELGPGPSDVWMEVQVHKDRVPALAGYDEADRWFSDFLGVPCHLVFIPDEVRRPVDPEWAPGHRVGFADGYPLHLATQESLQDMNRRLSRETSMLRYRPNLVVAGGLPWDEDEWRVLEIGQVKVHLVKPCARCTVITVDQGTGAQGQEPLWSLRAFREWNGKVFFGQNAVFEEAGRFRVGDVVRILEKGDRRPPLST
jgi:uncharacterized protein YcbX